MSGLDHGNSHLSINIATDLRVRFLPILSEQHGGQFPEQGV
jgi:hypothetical protein